LINYILSINFFSKVYPGQKLKLIWRISPPSKSTSSPTIKPKNVSAKVTLKYSDNQKDGKINTITQEIILDNRSMKTLV
jgi:hypothetical protein